MLYYIFLTFVRAFVFILISRQRKIYSVVGLCIWPRKSRREREKEGRRFVFFESFFKGCCLGRFCSVALLYQWINHFMIFHLLRNLSFFNFLILICLVCQVKVMIMSCWNSTRWHLYGLWQHISRHGSEKNLHKLKTRRYFIYFFFAAVASDHKDLNYVYAYNHNWQFLVQIYVMSTCMAIIMELFNV